MLLRQYTKLKATDMHKTVRHTSNGTNGLDGQTIGSPENTKPILNEHFTEEQKLEDIAMANILLAKHTEVLLCTLTHLNLRRKDKTLPLFNNIDQLTLQDDELQGYLKLNNQEKLVNVPVVFKGITVSQDHLQFMADVRDTAMDLGDPYELGLINIISYPYSPKSNYGKDCYIKIFDIIFDLETKETYHFYKSFFKNKEVQKALLDYVSCIEEIVGIDLSLNQGFDVETFERHLFLTWIKIKGRGKTHDNKHNALIYPQIKPITERHLHLAMVLNSIFINWPARCYANEDQLSVIRLVSRKCFNTNFKTLD